MRALQRVLTASLLFCLATAAAEAGLLIALWQRGSLTSETAKNLLMVAYDVPVRDIEERLLAEAHPARREMVSFAEVQEAKTLAHLDLDLRDMSTDKGLIDLRELDAIAERERNRYATLKEEFDRRWEAMSKYSQDEALHDVRRQIESVAPNLAKDQLERILNDEELDRDEAMKHVVTIFKGLSSERRKKIVTEFLNEQSPQLHEILREIRLGMPQALLIHEARGQLDEFLREN